MKHSWCPLQSPEWAQEMIFISHQKWMSFYYLLLLWARCCRSQCGSLKPGMACWNRCCGLTQSDPAKTESRPFLHLLAQNTDGMLRAHCISLMFHSVLLVCFYNMPVCFTPQDWILLHVIRNDFAGIHVTKVEFPSFLWKMRAWWEPETYTHVQHSFPFGVVCPYLQANL